MRVSKILAVGLIVLTVCLALAATLIATLDLSWAKQELSRRAKEEKQRHLIIEEDVQFSFFPRPSIRLGKISLSEFQSNQEFARIDKARISAQLIPLLSKKLVIDHIELSGIQIRLVRHADGRFNFDDLLGTKSPQPSSVEFDVGKTSLSGNVEYHDESRNLTFRIQDISLECGRVANQSSGPLNLSGQFKYEKQMLQFSLSTHYHLNLEEKQFRLEAFESQITGLAANVPHFKVKLSASTLEKHGNTMLMEGVRSEFAATLGNINIAGMLILGHLGEAADKNIQINPVTVLWDIQQGLTRAHGQLTGTAEIDPRKQSVKLPHLAGSIEIENPSLRMKRLKLPLTGMLESNPAKNLLAANLNTRFDETTAHSSWSVPSLSTPSLHFILRIDSLNLDKYLLSEKNIPARVTALSEKTLEIPNKRRSTPSGEIIRGVAKIGSLSVGNNRIRNIEAHLNLSDGKTDLAPSP